MYFRPILPQDREPLAALLRRIENFIPEEIDVAIELIDEAILRPELSGYRCVVALETKGEEDVPAGYICFGRTPMTERTYDLYWIAVDQTFRGKGIGVKLLRAMDEVCLQASEGRAIIRVETSSKESYRGTLQFYLNDGFEIAGRIPQFYRDDDDLYIIYKALGPK